LISGIHELLKPLDSCLRRNDEISLYESNDMEIEQEKIREAARWVKEASAIVIAAGAGMGVDSGLPDFRGPQGLWRSYPALAASGKTFQDIATPSIFWTDPRFGWGFYGSRLLQYRKIQPHAGFTILRRWAGRAPDGYRVFTSNVDGQFQRAGFPSDHVHECHGSIHALQCLVPCRAEIWSADDFHPEVDEARGRLLNELPFCPVCRSLARPNVYMFGDYDWIDGPTMASRNLLDAWVRTHRNNILVIEIGAGTDIPTVRNFSERSANRLLRINLRQAGVRGGANNLGIEGTALEVLSKIDEIV
jgi:NAD-dependent SIR2 family protein deacetylase